MTQDKQGRPRVFVEPCPTYGDVPQSLDRLLERMGGLEPLHPLLLLPRDVPRGRGAAETRAPVPAAQPPSGGGLNFPVEKYDQ